MAEINEICVFEVGVDQILFNTRTNGDSLRITGLRLTQEQATSLAWLINSGEETKLRIRIKVKGGE